MVSQKKKWMMGVKVFLFHESNSGWCLSMGKGMLDGLCKVLPAIWLAKEHSYAHGERLLLIDGVAEPGTQNDGDRGTDSQHVFGQSLPR